MEQFGIAAICLIGGFFLIKYLISVMFPSFSSKRKYLIKMKEQEKIYREEMGKLDIDEWLVENQLDEFYKKFNGLKLLKKINKELIKANKKYPANQTTTP